MGKVYSVALPIAGHIYVDVEAEDEDSAIAVALEREFQTKDIENWEIMERGFTRGNVCYCPQPWDPEAELIDSGEDA